MFGLVRSKRQPILKPPETKQMVRSVGAPIGGLNGRDGIGTMPVTDALYLENWIPQPIGLKCRKGYSDWKTGLVVAVRSIFQRFPATSSISSGLNYAYTPSTLTGQVFAATDAGIYDITARGAVGAAVQVLSGGLYAGHIQTNMFTNAAANWLLVNSELDGYFTYDGATWTQVTMGAGPTQVSGVNPANLVMNLPFKHRVWFVERNSTKLWYLGTDAIYGAATLFDIGPLLKKGGAISYIANWTMDAGTGIDDQLVIVSDNGDVILYKGTDPAAAATWSQVGAWEIGNVPRGRRAYTQYGGDLLLLSVNGLFPVSYVTRGGAGFLQATGKEYTSKIQGLINADLAQSFNLYGWEVDVLAKDNLIIITVPDNNGVVSKQYAMDTTTNQWTVFTGMSIAAGLECSGWYIYGQSSGAVRIGFSAFLDGVSVTDTGGSAINGYVVPAFSYFGMEGTYKHFLMVRPTFLAILAPGIQVRMCTDFQIQASTQTPVFTPASRGLWDLGTWDTSKWDGPSATHQSWIGVAAVGYAGSLDLLTTTVGDTLLNSIDYMMEVGGPL